MLWPHLSRMPEYRYYERGRRFIDFTEAANRAAAALGDSIPFPLVPPWWRRLLTFVWLLLRLRKNPRLPEPLPPNPNRLWWAGLHLPLSEATGHFLIIGSSGSGKSLTIDSLEQSALSHFRPGSDQRAFIFDLKREKYSRLMNQNLSVPIHLMDPMDQRGVAWDIASDVTSPAEARQLARVLIQGGKNESDRFWIEATRNILGGVFTVLAELFPNRWTLRDALLVMRHPKRIAHVLGLLPETSHLWSEDCRDEKTTANLMESFNSFLQRYDVVAAVWHRCPRKLSLKEWVKSDSVLLVPGHPKFAAVLQPIHQAILDFLADLVLSEPDSHTRRSWFFLDEARDLGRVEKLNRLANLGRSKGVSLVLGIQSIEGFTEAYGSEHLAREILGQLSNVTWLRTSSAHTAEAFVKFFGEVEILVRKINSSTSYNSKGGTTYGTSIEETRRMEKARLGSELMGIPRPSESQPVVMFNDVPLIGSFVAYTLLRNFLERNVLPDPRIPNVIEVLPKEMTLTEWKSADAKRLRLPPEFLRLPSSQPDLLLAQLKTIQND